MDELEDVINISIDDNSVEIENIEGEKNLIDYTESHFINQINYELNIIRNNDVEFIPTKSLIRTASSHSPWAIPNEEINSNIDIEGDSDCTFEMHNGVNIHRFSKSYENSNYYLHNHSPVLSTYGSRSNSDIDEEHDAKKVSHLKYKKLCYEDIERSLNRYYDVEIDNKFSSETSV